MKTLEVKRITKKEAKALSTIELFKLLYKNMKARYANDLIKSSKFFEINAQLIKNRDNIVEILNKRGENVDLRLRFYDRSAAVLNQFAKLYM